MSISSETIQNSPTKLTYNEYVLFPDECLVSRYLLDAAGRFSDAVDFKESITFDRIAGGAIVDLTRVW